MVKVTCLSVKAGSRLRFSFGVRPWTEMEIQCVKGMHRLKLVSCENNSGFKGLLNNPQSLLFSFNPSLGHGCCVRSHAVCDMIARFFLPLPPCDAFRSVWL